MGFQVVKPSEQSELFSVMEENDCRLVAGGTDVYVKLKKELIEPNLLVDIREVINRPAIVEEEDRVIVSATATHQEIASSELIRREFPVLTQAAGSVGGTQLRNMGTIGGNICNASPSGDTLVPDYLLEAELNLISPQGDRTLPVDQFVTGPGETKLERSEYLESVVLEKLDGDYSHHFEKVGRRNALDISVCSMGYILKMDGEIVDDLRLAYGAVAPTPIRVPEVEKELTGKPLTAENLKTPKKLVKESVSPISDIRGSAGYRRTVAARLVDRLLDSGN